MLGWQVLGIWSDSRYDPSDINSVNQSSPCIDPETGEKMDRFVAIADDYTNVKLFKYPCPTKEPKCHVLKGHGSHVTNVRFGPSNRLLSTGGDDRCVIQWSMIKIEPEHYVSRDAQPRRDLPWSRQGDNRFGLGRAIG